MPKPAKPIILVLTAGEAADLLVPVGAGGQQGFQQQPSPSYKLATSRYLLMTINSES